LTRFRERYPGFEARESRVRVYTDQPGEFPRPAASLIGTVSAVDVFDLQRQRDRAQRLRELWNRPRRSLDEELELQKLVGSVVLSDEVRGVSGVEGFWDPELRGRNGYLESRGLQDVFGGGEERRSVTEPEDGWDVRLTLDLDLQVAARRTLAHPEIVADPRFDEAWAASPVGAIVLVTPEGDVLAAASEPDEDSDVGAGARGQRGVVLDRTLRRPTFQPLGSVFKPFVAIHALDRIGLDPGMRVDCAPIERGGCGYVDVRCHAASGHGEVDLRQALVRSCNAYFARLGEMLSTDDFRAVAEDFGFGRPTGVRTPPPWDSGLRPRLGLVENTYPRLFRAPLEGIAKRLAGNGLAVVEGTPMQLARAMAGLATGRLPELRLVERVGARELRRAEATPVPIAGEHLELVRAALRGVTNESDGTAHAALSRARVGLRIAVKTGSADLTSRSADDEPRIRKHTWVGGWAPAEDPALVFVVFVHDTATTSSHGAVYVVRQLLRQPEVHAWLAERGVALDAAAEEAR
jgi:penicillin-binding protein 2